MKKYIKLIPFIFIIETLNLSLAESSILGNIPGVSFLTNIVDSVIITHILHNGVDHNNFMLLCNKIFGFAIIILSLCFLINARLFFDYFNKNSKFYTIALIAYAIVHFQYSLFCDYTFVPIAETLDNLIHSTLETLDNVNTLISM